MDDEFPHPGGYEVRIAVMDFHQFSQPKFLNSIITFFPTAPTQTCGLSTFCFQILAEHAGTDITDLLSGEDPLGHSHSTAALHLLKRFYLGTLTTTTTFQKSKLLLQRPTFLIDESKPLLCQVGSLGTHYTKWVESPVPGHPRFFKNSLAEAVTKTPWWVVPLVWLPLAAHQILYKASGSFLNDSNSTNEVVSTDVFWESRRG